MANMPMKRYSASLIIREMQIKPTMRCHLTPNRMATIKKKKENNKYPGRCGEIGTHVLLVDTTEKWYSYCGKQNGGGLEIFK